MSNVVKLKTPNKVQKQIIKQIASALRVVWLARKMDTDAYFLGINILARMQEAQQYQVCASPRDIAYEAVEVEEGGLVGGHAFNDLRRFIGAAQGIHHHVFLLSDFRLSELNRPDARERHFTRAPDLHAHVDFDVDTPIWFRFDVEHINEMCEHIDEINAEFRENISNLRTLELK